MCFWQCDVARKNTLHELGEPLRLNCHDLLPAVVEDVRPSATTSNQTKLVTFIYRYNKFLPPIAPYLCPLFHFILCTIDIYY